MVIIPTIGVISSQAPKDKVHGEGPEIGRSGGDRYMRLLMVRSFHRESGVVWTSNETALSGNCFLVVCLSDSLNQSCRDGVCFLNYLNSGKPSKGSDPRIS